MRSTKYFLLLIPSLFCLHLSAQSLKDQFAQAFTKDDTTAEIRILAEWNKTVHDDPDRYVDAFNYYAKRGLTEVLSLTSTKNSSNAFELKDKKNKTVGYLGSTPSLNQKFINEGFACIDSAITKFPNRLDMRFGKVYVLGRVFDYDKFTQEIIRAIDYGQTINNKWLWRDGKPLDNPEKFMLGTVQSYFIQLYDAGDEHVANMRRIAESVLKYYPDNVENLSDVSITYMIGKEYNKALVALTRAEKIAPQDLIVLNNIAFCSAQMGDKENAVKYYGLVIKYGDDDAKKNANQKIKALNKK
jgi:tetratricopeptide (TPR) repeat protein